jgi:transposase
MVDQTVSNRLKSKSVQQSIITRIAKDFNLTPLLAEAYFTQVKEYFLQHSDVSLSSGQLHYLAVEENEPAGKPISLCKKISVKLSLHKPEEDLAVYKKSGLRGLRQHKLLRITNEAIEQGGVLSYEDLAFILTTSVVTVKRDMSQMRRTGIVLPSRGWRHEMGRGQTHKTQILDMYLSGYQFSDIQKRTKHSEGAIKRYIQDFSRVVLLHKKKFSFDQIRISTGFSHRLIGEYIKLFKQHSNSSHVKRILQTSKKKGR